ncbi:MAG: hypothetical protein IKS17_02205 [Firmicutes bacterium]|nr:hypothetical protein [Bacillota bacterium]
MKRIYETPNISFILFDIANPIMLSSVTSGSQSSFSEISEDEIDFE